MIYTIHRNLMIMYYDPTLIMMEIGNIPVDTEEIEEEDYLKMLFNHIDDGLIDKDD